VTDSRNTGLLSFGDSEEIPTEATAVKRKGMGREDCEYMLAVDLVDDSGRGSAR